MTTYCPSVPEAQDRKIRIKIPHHWGEISKLKMFNVVTAFI